MVFRRVHLLKGVVFFFLQVMVRRGLGKAKGPVCVCGPVARMFWAQMAS